MKKIVIIAAAFFVAACQSEMEREQVAAQELAIENYVTQCMADTSLHATLERNNGSYRLIFAAGTEPAAEAGDRVAFEYIGYIFSRGSKVPFDTNRDTLGFRPQYNGGSGTVGAGQFLPGLDDGLRGMKTGEKAEILFSSTYGYGNTSVGLVPPLSALLFEVEMKEVIKQ
jgi:FKBP-type peptidyl-prolyl cis-trans isomerase